MKKTALFLFSAVLFSLATARPVFAQEQGSWPDDENRPQTYGEALGLLTDQVKKLRKQNAPACPGDYRRLFGGKDLRIAFFYGYEDFGAYTGDAVHMRALVDTLKKPCAGAGLEVCGFRASKIRRNLVELTKKIGDLPVIISVYSTSLTDDNWNNLDYERGYWAQNEASKAVRRAFHDQLVKADVVFYSGHSRLGGGPGFDPQTREQIALNFLFKMPSRPFLKALGTRPSRLKLLAMMSCQSDKYYRSRIERANPGLSMILTTADIGAEEGEQVNIGALNSILARKCRRDFVRAMHPVLIDEYVMKLVLKPSL